MNRSTLDRVFGLLFLAQLVVVPWYRGNEGIVYLPVFAQPFSAQTAAMLRFMSGVAVERLLLQLAVTCALWLIAGWIRHASSGAKDLPKS